MYIAWGVSPYRTTHLSEISDSVGVRFAGLSTNRLGLSLWTLPGDERTYHDVRVRESRLR